MGTDPDETDLSVRAKGLRFAGFELIQRIDTDSNNAFGEVWLAKRLQPFQRVAIKFLRRDRMNEEMVERFSRAESKALARFNHPYIARFYELGFHGPVPYLVMQYVPGDRITAYADGHGLSMAERLRLMAKVCDAVQHVHLQGVVHRDLKPANILVSESRPEAEDTRDSEGRERSEEDSSEGRGPIPVLIDFGLAKSANPDAPLTSAVVSRGGMAGTPAYASPEQIAAKNPEDTGQPADIYALGAVLFELLVGVSPMEHVLSDTTLSDPERLSRLAKDDRPSMAEAYARLTAQRQKELADLRGIGVAEMRRLLRSRLAHLTDRALRQDPGSRFSDARALALDIGNYLADRDYLEAAAEPRLEKWRRAVRRNRLAVGAGTAVVLALATGLGLATWQWVEAEAAKQAAVYEGRRAQDTLAAMSMGIALDSARRGDTATTAEQVRVLETIGARQRFATILAVALSDQSWSGSLSGLREGVTAIAASPDGRLLACAFGDRSIGFWDSATFTEVGARLRGHKGAILGLSFSRDGRRLASASDDESVRVWDVDRRIPIGSPSIGLAGPVKSVAFERAGRFIASTGTDDVIRLWDGATGQPLGEPLRGHEDLVTSIAFSPDGKMIASGSLDMTLRLWDVSTGEPVGEPLRGHEDYVNSVAFSPDGKTLASGSLDMTLRLWDASTGEPVGEPLRGHEGAIRSVVFSPDGRVIASGSADRTLRVWDVRSARQIGRPLRGQGHPITSVSFLGDDFSLISHSFAATESEVRIWDLHALRDGEPVRQHSSAYNRSVNRLAFSPDGRMLASACEDGLIRILDVEAARSRGEPLRGHEGAIRSVAFSSDGRMLASAGSDGTIRLWDVDAAVQLGAPLRGHEVTVQDLAITPDGKSVIVAAIDTLSVWSIASGERSVKMIARGGGAFTGASLSPDGKLLASVSVLDGLVRLWDVASGSLVGQPLAGHTAGAYSIAFSPNGELLASTSVDRTVRLWDVASASEVAVLRGHDEFVTRAAFNADGRTVASAAADGTLMLWDIATMKQIGMPLEGKGARIDGLAFSPDGRILAAGFRDGTVKLWNAVPMAERHVRAEAFRAHVDEARRLIQDRIDRLGPSATDVRSLEANIRVDPAFTGDRRIAALTILAELGDERRAQVSERLRPLLLAIENEDMERALALLALIPEDDLDGAGADFWNRLAWYGLTELPADSPARDLKRLLSYAERAVELSQRKDAAILDTLARAHWELGDKRKAVDVQEEAVRAGAGAGDGLAEELRRELIDTLDRYRTAEPPAPPGSIGAH